MEIAEHIKNHLSQMRMMQVATVQGAQPWICTVYYVADDAQNLYWLSMPERRHSQDIAANSKVAIAIPVKFDQPVIGIQAEGTATVVKDREEVKRVMEGYVAKYNSGKDFYDNFVNGANQHNLYKFTPGSYVLFDEVNFADDPRQSLQIS